ncbi:MAG: M14 family zinc carboxypeptidase [Ignavibacteriales bacterium]|nr:M14 family zinc carboxypeptidase [Ignavibacteriales bacterium]
MKKLILFFLLGSIAINAQIKTPLEKSNYSKLTSNSELINFVKQLPGLSKFITFDTLAISPEGKLIPLLKISKNSFGKSKGKIKVLIFAQQHGNEHSGKEAALILLKQITLGKLDFIFDKIDLLLVPQMNPDGNDKDQRKNGHEADLNRNHLILTEPEVIGLHKVFNQYLPEATLDLHEYGPFSKDWMNFGYRKDYDEQIGKLTNPNIYKPLLEYQNKKYLPYIKKFLDKSGFSSNEYAVGGPPDKSRLRYSTVDINDGRQSFGILNTFSFIIEGKNGRESLDNIKKRAEGQYTAILGFLKFIHDNNSSLKKIVTEGRNILKKKIQEDVSIQMEHIGDGRQKMNMLSVKTGKDTTIDVVNYHTKVESILKVNKPLGYLIPKTESELISLLQRNNVKIATYNRKNSDQIQEYYIIKKLKTKLEELYINTPVVELKDAAEIESDKYFFVPLTQIYSNMLVLLFEPQSMMNLLQYEKFSYLLKENDYYPILRVIEKKKNN